MISIRTVVFSGIFATLGGVVPLRAATEAPPQEGVILARIKAPDFAARDFPITRYGAVNNADSSAAITRAIASCHAAGGGRVVIPPGVWVTGAVHLKSNVNLHLAEGSTLRFNPDPTQYLPLVLTRFEGIECMNYSPLIYAFEQENVAVTGKGTLDGSASLETWWAWNDPSKGRPTKQVPARKRLDDQGTDGVPVAERLLGEGSFLRPAFIQPYRCRNVLIDGIRIINSPMWEMNPVLCTNVIVRGVTVVTHGSNNDGCNPESCKDVLIEDCLFDTGDDCIAIKSGRNNDGRRIGVPSENIVIRRCTMREGHGGVTMGSEISGGVRNVFVSDCRMDSPNLDRAIRIKSNAVRGGVIENIFVRDVTIGRVGKAVLSIEFDYEEGAKGTHRPTLRNVLMQNITCESSERVSLITAIPDAVIEGVRFENSDFRGILKDDLLKSAASPEYQNVSITRDKDGNGK
ncbi:MAG: glycoside hydrolase family 28 protein [Verrucomicrobiota bacterium]